MIKRNATTRTMLTALLAAGMAWPVSAGERPRNTRHEFSAQSASARDMRRARLRVAHHLRPIRIDAPDAPGRAATNASCVDVLTVVDPAASPLGYESLALHDPVVADLGGEDIENFAVAPFEYGGQSYAHLGVVSNGYVVVGGGSGPQVQGTNSDLPDAAEPNNVIAPFWTRLNPGAGGRVLVQVLTDGAETWTVVEWESVPNHHDGETNTCQVWIGANDDSTPAEDISFVYGPDVSDGDNGNLTVGGENSCGSRGSRVCYNGDGTPPAPSTTGYEVRVLTEFAFGCIDCNDNCIDDSIDALTLDCNANGIPDECDVDPTDPDGDGLVSGDCQGDGIPDECQVQDVLCLDQPYIDGPIIYSDIGRTAPQVLADQVALPTAQAIVGVRFWGGTAVPFDPDQFTIIIRPDDGTGRPDATSVVEFAPQPADAKVSVPSSSGFETFEYTIVFDPPVDLPAGTFWFEIFNDTTDDPVSWGFFEGMADPVGGLPDFVGSDFPPPDEIWLTQNGRDLALQVLCGFGSDCNFNGVPDECEQDCNGNGIADECDITDGTSADCNFNAVPDECDLDVTDPDGDGFVSEDCQPDGIPDECQLAAIRCLNQEPREGGGYYSDLDCDVCTTGVQVIADDAVLLDEQTIVGMSFYGAYEGGVFGPDQFIIVIKPDAAGVPGASPIATIGPVAPTSKIPVDISFSFEDEYLYFLAFDAPVTLPAGTYWFELYNNTAGSASSWYWMFGALDPPYSRLSSVFSQVAPPAEVWNPSTEDLDAAFQLICSLGGDCNDNGVPDDCDLTDGTSEDCNTNGIPDECDIADGTSEDCNTNGVPDDCDLTAGTSEDCNTNGVPDECDIASGASEDCNINTIPDECETVPEFIPGPGTPPELACVDAQHVCPGFEYPGTTFPLAPGVNQTLFCGVFFGSNDVFYRYRPRWSGDAFVTVEGPPRDWLISVHGGCPATSANQIVCDAHLLSVGVTFPVDAEAEYIIRIAASGFDWGPFLMNMVGPDCVTSTVDTDGNGIPDECDCFADVNGDRVVDSADYMAVLMAQGPCASCPEDVDGSGVVDSTDLQIVLVQQGPCPFP